MDIPPSSWLFVPASSYRLSCARSWRTSKRAVDEFRPADRIDYLGLLILIVAGIDQVAKSLKYCSSKASI